MNELQQQRRQQAAIRQRQKLQRQKVRQRAKQTPPPAIRGKNTGYHPGKEVVEKFNNTVYIIGGGPSLEFFNWNLLDHTYFVVGVNNAYSVLPKAQIIYFTDDDWYNVHKAKGLLDHTGTKIKGSLNPATLSGDANIKQMHLKGEHGLSNVHNILSHGRNSPYAAINMVIQWGFNTIYLMGMDMQHGRPDEKSKSKKRTHFHNGHRRIDPENAYPSFMKNYEKLPPLIEKLNVKIININNSTKLDVFPIETYEEHFGKSWSTKK